MNVRIKNCFLLSNKMDKLTEVSLKSSFLYENCLLCKGELKIMEKCFQCINCETDYFNSRYNFLKEYYFIFHIDNCLCCNNMTNLIKINKKSCLIFVCINCEIEYSSYCRRHARFLEKFKQIII